MYYTISIFKVPQSWTKCDFIRIYCCLFRCSGTGKRFSNRKETSCLPLLNTGFEARGSSGTESPADWMTADKPAELPRIKLKKTWTRQPAPTISKHSAHSTPLLGERQEAQILKLWCRKCAAWLWNKYVLFFSKTLFHTHNQIHTAAAGTKCYKTM